MRNPCQVSHTHGLAIIRVRSPLLTESLLFSSPTGTEMFHFPAYTPTQTIHSPAGTCSQQQVGFPIRTSSDQRFVGNSPRHNAASHVLHRPSMPRHPPYALHTKNTKTKHNKKERKHNTHKQQPPPTTQWQSSPACIDARVHYTVLTQHTHTQPPPHSSSSSHMQATRNKTMLPQTPNSMPTAHTPQHTNASEHITCFRY